jgi:hypothetical protein
MPSDDRERSFQNALARHLSPDVPGDACVDAETLAAYHERSLTQPQMASLKVHISECGRCQQILAQLQATDEVPIATANIALPQTVALKPDVRVLAARRPTLWRWVAPAGALAAALLVWIAVHESNIDNIALRSPQNDTNQTQTAKAQPAPALPRPSLDATRQSETRAPDESNSSPATRSPRTAVPFRQRPQALAKQSDLDSLKKRSPSVNGVIGGVTGAAPNFVAPSAQKPDSQLEMPRGVTQTVTVEPAPPQATNQVAGADQGERESQAKSANEKRDAVSSRPAPFPSVMAGGASAPPPPPAAPPSASESVQVATESSAISNLPVENRNVANLTNLNQSAQLLLASSGAVTVPAPDGRVSWRIGQGGVILFSPDAGKTWLVQPSGIVTDLLAGSAPSARVCWIVGRSGTILRTTDKGKHWKKVQPPTQDDLVSVFAVNDRQATVSPANGTYQTTDGGATWTKLPHE